MPVRQSTRRRTVRRSIAAVAAVALVAACRQTAFLSSTASTTSEASSRRSFLAAAGIAAVAPTALPSFAEEGKKAPPENLEVKGATGKYADSQGLDINGRWGIVFGNTLNKRPTYKKAGGDAYLVYNDCNQFQMTKKLSGECTGFGINVKGVWTFDGLAKPDVKVKPVTKVEAVVDPEAAAAEAAAEAKENREMQIRAKKEKEDLNQAVITETNLLQTEADTETFRGKMTDDNEQLGDRLMSKMGAKIAKGY